MEPDKAVLLCARRSYNSTVEYSDSAMLKKANFLEKISIPRGKRDNRDIFDHETAIREFIEETGTFFESAYVYRRPFVLQWIDAGVVYKYAIYVGILNGLLISVSREPNTFCVKLNGGDKGSNDYRVDIETRRHNRELPRHVYIVSLQDYFQYMNEKQLITYDFSNYREFFEYVKFVKAKFDESNVVNCEKEKNGHDKSGSENLFGFFLLSLKLNRRLERWKSSMATTLGSKTATNTTLLKRCPSSIIMSNSSDKTNGIRMMNRQDLKNIVNAV
nr:orf28 [Trichoplusia ni single nucleopolyhedrovirus]